MLPKFMTVVAVASTLQVVSAQTWTTCNPLEKKCPNRKAVGAKPITIDFTKGKSDFFYEEQGTILQYDPADGAQFIITERAEAPTISSHKWIFFGQVDVVAKASPGKGLVSSFVLQSDDLDEIDWEWLGKDNDEVQTNYFSKGCTETYDRGGMHAIPNTQGKFHTYTIKWTTTELQWLIDGVLIRELKAAGLSGCAGYPQTPMQLKLGNWVAGQPGQPQGRIDWAGGLADYVGAPYIGSYRSIKVTDFMGGHASATEYAYGDHSGTWQSIKVIGSSGKGDQDPKSSAEPSSTSSAGPKPSGTGASSTLATSTVGPSASGSGSSAAPSSTGGPNGPDGLTNAAPTDNDDPKGTDAPDSAAGKLALGNLAVVGAALLFGAMWL